MNMEPSQNLCKNCEKKLTSDEKAIYLKLVDRTASRFLCLDCRGEKMGCGREPLEKRILYYSAKKGVSPLHTNQEEKLLFILLNHDYFLINNDFPVISAGCSIPIISIIVGTISARHPPSRSV